MVGTNTRERMKLVITSDTHGFTPDLPEGDLLLHAGDLTMIGSDEEIAAADKWLGTQRHKFENTVVVPGNHDFCFDKKFRESPITELENATVLINRSIEVGGITIWGSPYSTEFGGWAFMGTEEELAAIWKDIPDNTDIVVTHGPAYGIRDMTIGGTTTGSRTLENRLREVRPRYHIFGHIHEAYGITYRTTTFINASYVDFHYHPAQEPFEFET